MNKESVENSFRELLFSNDGNFVFACKSYSGISQEDCNPNKASSHHEGRTNF
jgi:hypothetical protein